MLATQAVTPELEEIYSSSMHHHPLYHQGQYHQLQQHDAQAILFHAATPGKYPHLPFSDKRQSQYAESSEEMQRRANFAQRRAWMKRVAEWIAQTEMTGNDKPHHLDSIMETTEETQSPREQVLYIASPPSSSIPVYPFANTAGAVYSSSSASSSSSSLGSAKSLRRSSHGRTSSLESISEEAEE